MTGVPVRGIAATGLALLLALPAPPVAARGQLQAGPTLLEIGPRAGSTRLNLSNSGDQPVAAQVRVYAWSQPDGEDRLALTDELAVSPPILELPPGGEQVVRLVRLAASPSGRDLSYRVVVDELPGTESAGDSRVHLRMRYVIPVFVRAADAAKAELSCTLEGAGERLACENRGGRAAQLGASRLLGTRGGVTLSEGLFGYVLPGSRRVWRLPAEASQLEDSMLQLETRLNGQAGTFVVERTP